jgi:hypothetical protein
VTEYVFVWQRPPGRKVCGDCGENPAPDQRPPKPGKKKDSRCKPCLREMARRRRYAKSIGWDTGELYS